MGQLKNLKNLKSQLKQPAGQLKNQKLSRQTEINVTADQLKATERSSDILVSQLEWPTGQLKNLKKSQKLTETTCWPTEKFDKILKAN